MKIHDIVSIQTVVYSSGECKPGEIRLSADLQKAYNAEVLKSPDTPISLVIVRYPVQNSTDVFIVKPENVLECEEKLYSDISINDAISLGVDTGGDIVFVIFRK